MICHLGDLGEDIVTILKWTLKCMVQDFTLTPACSRYGPMVSTCEGVMNLRAVEREEKREIL